MAVDDLLIERLLRIIDEGRRTATYKLALLLGIIDAAALSPGADELPTRLIAEQVLTRYYPQTRLYVDGTGREHRPRQISMKASPVMRAVESLRDEADQRGVRRLVDIQRKAPDVWARALDVIEDTFVRYPIPLLQVVGGQLVPFLYEVDWSEGTSVKRVRADGEDRVRLLPGVADRLVVLGPMLRPLIELHWTRDVAKWTRLDLEDESLRAHLFERERRSFPRSFVSDLVDLQNNDCFYCGDRLAKKVEVDHFLAFSRWPNDAVQNLVIADSCNGAKSDHLAAERHLVRWRLRLDQVGVDLDAIAERNGWQSSADRTRALVQSTYTHIAAGTPLWVLGSDFDLAVGPIEV